MDKKRVRAIAMVCYESWRAYKLSLGVPVISWQMASSGIRDKAIEKVEYYLADPIKFNEDNTWWDNTEALAIEKRLFCAIIDAMK